MKIGVDIMGGDFAPEPVVKGAILAHKELGKSAHLVLIGDEAKARQIIQNEGYDASHFSFVPTTEVINMGDHPAQAFKQKTNSSITVGFHLLGSGKIDGFASAGSTGAMMVGAMFVSKAIPGVQRPAISAIVPKPHNKMTILLDVGLNSDCKPEVLYQYGIIGSILAESVYGISNPKVGLMNIGSENEKGNIVSKATNEMMQGTKDFNFIGNVEGTDLFSERVDVIVCDGFVGNILLKTAEAFHEVFVHEGVKNPFLDRFNFENYGGTAVLGIHHNVVIGHGVSNDIAIKNMILHTGDVIKANLPERFKNRFTT